MHRFFADERGIVENIAYLNAEDAGHAMRVLRLEKGDEVELVCARRAIWRRSIRQRTARFGCA